MALLRILVVDDDQDFAESLADIFEDLGHDVELAFDGESAVERFQAEQFDLTFMDLRLPGINGMESFSAIQRLHPTAKVIMMSGYGVEPVFQQALEQGALAILPKPIDMNRVMAFLDELQPDRIIVVAEDDPDLADSLRQLLVEQGHTVMVAQTGAEAVDHILAHPVEILILDMVLPVFNGLEVYMRLRQHGRNIPTILITGYAVEESEAIEQLRSYAISRYMVKPLDPSELLRAIEAIKTQS